jgi:ribosomal protein S7
MSKLKLKRTFAIKKTVALIIKRGKKVKAFNLLCKGLTNIKKINTKTSALELFTPTVNKLQPYVTLKYIKKSGIKRGIPTLLSPQKSNSRACRLLVTSIRKRTEYTFSEKFSSEFLDLLSQQGLAIKRKRENEKLILESRSNIDFIR